MTLKPLLALLTLLSGIVPLCRGEAQQIPAQQAPAQQALAQKPPAPTVRIALIGDSTVASYSRPPADRPDLTGWGQVFGEYFVDRVKVLNHAQSGRSSIKT